MTPKRGRPTKITEPPSAGPRIYTRTGDRGETGLIGGRRVRKDDVRVEAYGAVDELNAQLGVVRAATSDAEVAGLLDEIQHQLFDLGATLATPPEVREVTPTVGEAEVEHLEEAIDRLQAVLPPLRAFILPGGTSVAAALHVARTVCRRAERRVVTLARAQSVPADLVRYLNRLSDLLFVLARVVNLRAATPDVIWRQDRRRSAGRR